MIEIMNTSVFFSIYHRVGCVKLRDDYSRSTCNDPKIENYNDAYPNLIGR